MTLRNDSFEHLMAFQRETEALAAISGRLDWDQETTMPRGAGQQRAEECAAIEGVLHARRTDPRLAEWLDSATPTNEAEAAQIRLIRREHTRATRIPARLARELAHLTSLSQGIWAEARAQDEVPHFLPTLERVIALKREEAEALSDGRPLYDALLDDYEPGISAAEIAAIFGRMRPRLVALREKVLGAPQPRALAGEFPADAQLRIARDLATAFGYDWTRGRLDLAVHPFSSGSGNDVRITTRTSESDPFNCFYSTIHEVGHAAYEQNIDQSYLLTPMGRGVSMGVHESQSRIYENQLGRSRPFTGWLYNRMRAEGLSLNLADENAFFAAVNLVRPGFIRTEADEVHYNLHIMLRFDLERALIAGDLAPRDLEAAWNDRFSQDFGVTVDRPSHGMLQDVHWSIGLFGYFPTYSLGNVYAGCLHQALRNDLPDLDTALRAGDTRPATEWLRDHLQRHGGLREPVATIAAACGETPTEAPLLDYLEAKFSGIYGL
jgi:carboxypeptidase Taq